MRLSFDSFCVRAIAADIAAFVGSRVQEIRQPNDYEIGLELYRSDLSRWLLLDWHPQYFRAHFVSARPGTLPRPSQLGTALRSRLIGARLAGARQVGVDRVIELLFESPAGDHRLVIELMGRHSNVALLDSDGIVRAAARWVSSGESVRPIQANRPYALPPGTDPEDRSNYRSATLQKLVDTTGKSPDALFAERAAWLNVEIGAYPVDLAPLGLVGFARQSFSQALESFYAARMASDELGSCRAGLRNGIERIRQSRVRSLAAVSDAIATGDAAARLQMYGELVMAYAGHEPAGRSVLEALDYEGATIVVPIDPELPPKETANRLFAEARAAKRRRAAMRENESRFRLDLVDAEAMLANLEAASTVAQLTPIEAAARDRGWLRAPTAVEAMDRPFEGRRIKELRASSGHTVYVGENAEANDYLLSKVARPNDYWLHVRGATSAHVVVATQNQPQRVPREALLYAARESALRSDQKHSSLVAVDFTLRKYVRKPKGAPKGSVTYTQEATLHIDPR